MKRRKYEAVIRLVQVQSKLYPYQEKDYQLLKGFGFALHGASTDTVPILLDKLRKTKVGVSIASLADVEEQILRLKVQNLCPLEFEFTKNSLTFKTKKPEHPKLLKLQTKLKTWYSRYGVKIESKITRSGLVLMKSW